MSKWKPGQIVTLGGKIYRIKRTLYGSDCQKCCGCYKPITSEPCHTCIEDFSRMPDDCHFEEIKPKSVMG